MFISLSLDEQRKSLSSCCFVTGMSRLRAARVVSVDLLLKTSSDVFRAVRLHQLLFSLQSSGHIISLQDKTLDFQKFSFSGINT